MAQRLPTPGGDNGTWGDILNAFLEVSHNPDGTLANNTVGTNQLQSGAITNAQLDSSTQTIIASVASKYVKPGGGIPGSDIANGAITTTQLDTTTNTALGKANSSVQSVNSKTPTSGNVIINVADINDVQGGSGATNNQVLSYNSGTSKWVPATVSSTSVSDATTGSKGIVELAGDLGGTAIAPTVPKASGLRSATTAIDVSAATAPTTGQALIASNSTTAAWGNIPTASNATSGAPGLIQLAGDLGGSATSPTVPKASGLRSATTAIDVSAATAPSNGQVLTAQSGTAATWTTPAAGVTLDGTVGDIQPDTVTGTAVAGATGKAADAGHQHPLVAHDHTTTNKGGQINPTTALTAAGTPSSSTFLRGDNTWTTPAAGVTLDATSTDIAPLGTQAAGAIGKAADAGHVHAMPRLDQVANPTTDVSLNSHKITSLANGSIGSDAAAFGQIPTTAAQVGAAQGLTPTLVKTSAYTAASGDFVPIDASGGTVGIALPSAPADKTRIGVKVVNNAATPNAVTITAGGSDRFNLASTGPTSITLAALYSGALLQYTTSTGLWYVTALETPLNTASGAAKLGTDGTVGGPGGSQLTSAVALDTPVADVELWISKSGADTNTGRSAGAAFLTLNAALTAALATGASGATFHIGVGTWNEDIVWYNGHRWIGSGKNLTYITSPNGSTAPGNLTTAPGVVMGGRIQGITFQGSSNAGQCGWYFPSQITNTSGPTQSSNPSNTFWQGGIWYSTFEDVTVHGYPLHQIWFRGGGSGIGGGGITITLSGALTQGTTPGALTVTALSGKVYVGQILLMYYVNGATLQQQFCMVSATANTSATSLSVTNLDGSPFVPNFSYPTSTTIISGTGNCPHQFNNFRNIYAHGGFGGYAFMVSGQCGQWELDGSCEFDGPGQGQTITGCSTNGTTALTLGSTAPGWLVNGMTIQCHALTGAYASNLAIPFLTTVTNVSGTTVTMSNPAGVSLSGLSVTFSNIPGELQNVVIVPESDTYGQNWISTANPYNLSFRTLTSQSNAKLGTLCGANILFDNTHMEGMVTGWEGINSPKIGGPATASNAHFRSESWETSCTTTGAWAYIQNGANVLLEIESMPTFGTAPTNQFVNNGTGNIILGKPVSGGAYAGAQQTHNASPAASLTLNYATTWMVTGDGGTTPITTLTSNHPPGTLLHLLAFSNSFAIASGGNITLPGGTTSVTVPQNGVATIVRVDLGKTWVLISVSGVNSVSGANSVGASVIENVNTVAASGSGTVAIPDVTTATMSSVTLTGTPTFTFPAAAAGKSFSMELIQDASGSRTVTWPTVKWAGGGTPPTLTATVAKRDVFTFACFDGTNWDAFVAGQNL